MRYVLHCKNIITDKPVLFIIKFDCAPNVWLFKMDKNKLFLSLQSSYAKAYPNKNKKEVQDSVVQIWSEIKKKPNLSHLVSEKIQEYKAKELTSKSNLFGYWRQVQRNSGNDGACSSSDNNSSIVAKNNVASSSVDNISPNTNLIEDNDVSVLSNSLEEVEISVVSNADSNKILPESCVIPITIHTTPAQSKLEKEISFLNDEIVSLTKRKESGLFDDDMKSTLKKKHEAVKSTKLKLKKLRGSMIRKRKYRSEFKKKLSKLCEKFPEARNELKASSKNVFF